MNINLPKYNQTVYAELLQAMVWNNKCALCAATGTGKSYIAAKFVQEAVIEQDTLILVPFRASAKIWNTLLPQATTMTYQGLLYNRPELAKYKLIICDEMHHLGADEWGKVFNELTENYHGKLLGLTATPIRFLDGNRNIAKEFFDGNDIQGVQLSEAIQKKILPTFEYVTALYDLPESKGNNELTEKLYNRLDFLRNEYSFQNILRKHLAGRHPVKAIVFVDSIQEIPKVMDSCREIFPDAVHLDAHSKYSGKENAETYEQFEITDGDCFLYVVDILNEGIHLSGANVEIMFRRTRSPIVYLQQLGRILSASNAENDVIIFDFVANHMNMREYTKMQNETVSRLSFDIGDPYRQIVQHDYALEELELLEKLHQLENNLWSEEEDALIQVLRKLCSYSFLPFLPLLLLSLFFCLSCRLSLFSEAGCVFLFLPDIFLIIFKTGTAFVCTYDYHILRTVIAVQDQFQMFLFNTEYIAATLYKQMAFFRFSCLTSRKIQTVL